MQPLPPGRSDLMSFITLLLVKASPKKKSKKVKKVKKIKKRAKQGGAVEEDMKWIMEDPHDEMFSRFVLDGGGKRLGESIGVDGRYLIVKSKMKFYKIPLEAIADEGDELRIIRRVDMDRARKLGETWKKTNL